MAEIQSMHKRLITLYTKMPLASQWPTPTPAQQLSALSTPEPLPSQKITTSFHPHFIRDSDTPTKKLFEVELQDPFN